MRGKGLHSGNRDLVVSLRGAASERLERGGHNFEPVPVSKLGLVLSDKSLRTISPLSSRVCSPPAVVPLPLSAVGWRRAPVSRKFPRLKSYFCSTLANSDRKSRYQPVSGGPLLVSECGADPIPPSSKATPRGVYSIRVDGGPPLAAVVAPSQAVVFGALRRRTGAEENAGQDGEISLGGLPPSERPSFETRRGSKLCPPSSRPAIFRSAGPPLGYFSRRPH